MKTKLTKRLVDGLKPGAADRTIFDTDVPGFSVRVRKTGGMSYAVEYKAGHGRGAPTRRVTIGPVGTMTPEQARQLLDAQKGEEKMLPIKPEGKPVDRSKPFKDW